MSKLIEALKNAGWVETTLGECQVGDRVLLIQAGHISRDLRVTRPAKYGLVRASDGGCRLDTTPVLRDPQPSTGGTSAASSKAALGGDES